MSRHSRLFTPLTAFLFPSFLRNSVIMGQKKKRKKKSKLARFEPRALPSALGGHAAELHWLVLTFIYLSFMPFVLCTTFCVKIHTHILNNNGNTITHNNTHNMQNTKTQHTKQQQQQQQTNIHHKYNTQTTNIHTQTYTHKHTHTNIQHTNIQHNAKKKNLYYTTRAMKDVAK
jgi:hypothetical protein